MKRFIWISTLVSAVLICFFTFSLAIWHESQPEIESMSNLVVNIEKQTTNSQAIATPIAARSFSNSQSAYQPNYEVVPVHPTNYGVRLSIDVNGVPVTNQPIIVLHETVSSAASTINFFQTPHYDERQQASYHALIKLDGTVVYLVPPEYRAFGAGNSIFDGASGSEAVKTHPNFPPSVNNFAYHVALETPPNGRNNARRHSGYTEEQYRSLAWLIAQSSVPDNRITTHRAVDRSGTRIDPRSFNLNKFLQILRTNRQQETRST
ncbi:peptidoglycan recognition protein family protein [Gloeocapsopsis dulcis]|uniref:N-acetylmuramoyl-L-alanine amidase n=1 Tax=Gloeocapsopsis dulcis AAB1 = 1H9 TaxID=1433147 RepID=A0A6N8G335_9CHRO|nr:peptidoglycan recognition family protein [Gloeocapsopsis dulcis]MUL39252.1 N-acetylmuramoyl-L-alanine amidase [Gloeocapsopsis dulcis AAB1 = 1H9]WNN90862.1 peptidoglycan recognition family protein [Gloeocapsopsis dulcis]